MAASPGALVIWLREHEPHVLKRARWLLSSTDLLRLMLTGTVATDRSMAAAGFLGLASRASTTEALDLFDLSEFASMLPPVTLSQAIVGRVSAAAARVTNVPSGTPVAAGAHDVNTGALGMGRIARSTTVLLGTYAINQVLGDTPIFDRRWQVRPFLGSDRWLHMSTSPAGAACLDWAATRVGLRNNDGGADSAAAVMEAQMVTPTLAQPYFLPFEHGRARCSGRSWKGSRSAIDGT
jgi:L-xylulokinase